ncbi:MAG: DNA alkylation repair protein [Clostridia bacterium]|nr:DNA alkylation repair protein [Clostridia bacterium]
MIKNTKKSTQPFEVIKNWNENDYNKFINYLISIQDMKYKEFHSSLVLNSKYEMIGIRVPILRDIAKIISKSDIEDFLKYTKYKYYEEVIIQGFVISNIKDEKLFYMYFKKYISKIDNWALCDSFCSSIKIIRKYKQKYFDEAVKLALNKSEFMSRVGLVMILNHFINQDNLYVIFDTLNKIQNNKFYINMAEAWLICEMYIKFPKETKEFIKENKLNEFTQNKAISKIHDSNRVSKEEKEFLKSFRKKI